MHLPYQMIATKDTILHQYKSLYYPRAPLYPHQLQPPKARATPTARFPPCRQPSAGHMVLQLAARCYASYSSTVVIQEVRSRQRHCNQPTQILSRHSMKCFQLPLADTFEMAYGDNDMQMIHHYHALSDQFSSSSTRQPEAHTQKNHL